MTHDNVECLNSVSRHDLTTPVQCFFQCIKTRLSHELYCDLERTITTFAGQCHFQLHLQTMRNRSTLVNWIIKLLSTNGDRQPRGKLANTSAPAIELVCPLFCAKKNHLQISINAKSIQSHLDCQGGDVSSAISL